MIKKVKLIFILLTFNIVVANIEKLNAKIDLQAINTFNLDKTINVIIEISAGTIEEWNFKIENNTINEKIKDGKIQIVDYLPYPFNYGSIPVLTMKNNQVLASAIVIGPSVTKGNVIKAKPIGAILLLESGNIKPKIIALSLNDTNLSRMNSIDEIRINYKGLIEIIEIWLTNYGGEINKIQGFLNKAKTIDYINNLKNDPK